VSRLRLIDPSCRVVSRFSFRQTNFNILFSRLLLPSADDEAISLGSKDTNDDMEEDEDDDEEVEVLPKASREVLEAQERAYPPAAVSIANRGSAFGNSLGSPSVARMPGTIPDASGPGYEVVGTRPQLISSWMPANIKTNYLDTQQIRHALVAILLPTGIATSSAAAFRLHLKIFGTDYYLSLEIEWPDTLDKDNGEIFLEFLKDKQLKQLEKKWTDLTKEAKTKAKREFDRSHVMRCMAMQQAMIQYRNWKGYTTLRSECTIKLDFATERLTDNNWWLIGDDHTGDGGVRLLVVDLEEAAAEEMHHPVIDRQVEMIGAPKAADDEED